VNHELKRVRDPLAYGADNTKPRVYSEKDTFCLWLCNLLRTTPWWRMWEWRDSSTTLNLGITCIAWSASSLSPFTQGEQSAGIHSLTGWDGHRADMDAGEDKQACCSCRDSNSNSPPLKSVACRYTGCVYHTKNLLNNDSTVQRNSEIYHPSHI
jgi:hypothetical protein